jgi:hypothetical protein
MILTWYLKDNDGSINIPRNLIAGTSELDETFSRVNIRLDILS